MTAGAGGLSPRRVLTLGPTPNSPEAPADDRGPDRGEREEEVMEALHDLRKVNVDVVTIGQYLSPGPKHLQVQRFVTPSKFNYFKLFGENELGFMQVVSSPLTRSSYHAEEIQKLMKKFPR